MFGAVSCQLRQHIQRKVIKLQPLLSSTSVLSKASQGIRSVLFKNFSCNTLCKNTFGSKLLTRNFKHQVSPRRELIHTGNPVEGVSLKPREGEFVQQPIGNTSRSLSTGGTSGENMPGEHVEVEVCGVGDLKDGEMKEVEVGEGKALLVKDGGQFYAVGAKCTHYGAPLVKGVLCNGRVRCPWHGACFNVKTGDIEEFPGFDSLPKFEVSISSGKVKVKADKASLSKTRRCKTMCCAAPDNNKSVVIVGGGPATVACVETLRQEGYEGKITVLSKDKYLPYDRIKLSKAMTIKPGEIALRDQDFYKSYDIEIQNEKEVVSVDPSNKSVSLADGATVKYDTLVVATGGRPRVLPIPGSELANICVLRTPDDANCIAEKAAGKRVVIVGSSFIGMEVASFLAEKAESLSVVDIIKVPFQLTLGEKVGAALQKVATYMVRKACSVDVIARGAVPLENVFGMQIGNLIKKMHEDKGVKFHFESGLKEFVGTAGSVSEVVLSDGTKLPADVVILGVGVAPATDFLKSCDIKMNRGFVTVDEFMQTSLPDIYAAGDIVEFPLFTVGDSPVNVQHWQMAHAHGRNAAYNILGRKQKIRSVPYFWTVMYGKSIRYTGYGPGYDDIVIHGDVDALKFVAFYTKGEIVVAVASLNYDPIVSQAAEYMMSGKTITKTEITEDPQCWVSRL